ncbi:uncharacterized protein BJ212DRAFT_72835 [Suillus subaureus]|uniref:Rhodopsin domain-containing protein n=1 Tax=Suillus subaureus TaxID=48587 RepID=A0A9P7EEN3_9AGAM|nr:uncharacterized protein BJ212DRAFT_72835 [Suillus subaureus]KAG1819111.1 hypothetical protein BJ212DRAFT_72835 [Suillus subaureus]
MSSPGPTLQQTEVADITLTVTAVLITSLRLCIRVRQKRLGIDDAWVALGMVFDFLLLISDCLYLQDYERYPQNTRIALYYMIAQFFYGVVWSSKLSMLFTIVRLTIPGKFRRFLMCAVGTFGAIWALLFSQLWWICETQPNWKSQPHPQCDLGRRVAITQMITDVLADFFLIVAPFFLIYKVRLSRSQKVRILSVFSTSAITTIVSLTHAYYIFAGGGLKEVMAAIVEASMSLIVANLSVVVAFIFRLSSDDDSPSNPTPIITFGGQHRTRMAATRVAVETTTIVLEDLSESRLRSMKTSDDDEIILHNNRERKQTKEWC